MARCGRLLLLSLLGLQLLRRGLGKRAVLVEPTEPSIPLLRLRLGLLLLGVGRLLLLLGILRLVCSHLRLQCLLV